MPSERPHRRDRGRYHDVNSAETRGAYRRNLYLMLAAAVGIAFSFFIPSMCPAKPEGTTLDSQTEEFLQILADSFDEYIFDAKSSSNKEGQFRCTVFVIADQSSAAPEIYNDKFDLAAIEAFGNREGEVVWRYYRRSSETAGGDPAFIGLHRSDLEELSEEPNKADKGN